MDPSSLGKLVHERYEPSLVVHATDGTTSRRGIFFEHAGETCVNVEVPFNHALKVGFLGYLLFERSLRIAPQLRTMFTARLYVPCPQFARTNVDRVSVKQLSKSRVASVDLSLGSYLTKHLRRIPVVGYNIPNFKLRNNILRIITTLPKPDHPHRMIAGCVEPTHFDFHSRIDARVIIIGT